MASFRRVIDYMFTAEANSFWFTVLYAIKSFDVCHCASKECNKNVSICVQNLSDTH